MSSADSLLPIHVDTIDITMTWLPLLCELKSSLSIEYTISNLDKNCPSKCGWFSENFSV